jgi:hypothetical protein
VEWGVRGIGDAEPARLLDELAAGKVLQGVAQLLRRPDHHGEHLVDRLGPGLNCRILRRYQFSYTHIPSRDGLAPDLLLV